MKQVGKNYGKNHIDGVTGFGGVVDVAVGGIDGVSDVSGGVSDVNLQAIRQLKLLCKLTGGSSPPAIAVSPCPPRWKQASCFRKFLDKLAKLRRCTSGRKSDQL